MFSLIDPIITETLKGIIEYFKKHQTVRNYSFFISPLICTTCCIILNFYGDNFIEPIQVLLGAIAVTFFILTSLALISLGDFKTNTEILANNLNDIKQEREKLIEKIGDDSVTNMARLTLNRMDEYYTINLNQAKTSYQWSIASIIIGLITLVTGIWLLFFMEKPNVTMGIISGASGILVEFIDACNIYIYNKSLSQLNLYFRQLATVQDTMLAVELCEKVSDENPKKIEITEKIILNLINRTQTSENS